MSKEKRKDVRFIRKKGRIIPIKIKDPSQYKYKKVKRPGTVGYVSTTDHRVRIGKKAILEPKTVYHSNVSRYVIDHELGHLKASREKGTMNWKQRQMLNKVLGKQKDEIKKLPKLRFAFHSMFVAPFTNLKAEYEATDRAIKAVRRREGKAGVKRAKRVLQPAYATYAGHALFTGGGLASLVGANIREMRPRLGKTLSRGGLVAGGVGLAGTLISGSILRKREKELIRKGYGYKGRRYKYVQGKQ